MIRWPASIALLLLTGVASAHADAPGKRVALVIVIRRGVPAPTGAPSA